MDAPLTPRFTWHGHACVELVAGDGTTILLDPWFGNPRSTRRADSVQRCDVLLVTHGHGDHLGDAIELALRLGPSWPAIHELSLWVGPQLDDDSILVGMNKGGTVDVAGLRVTMVRAEHSAGGPVEGPGAVYLGEPVGFVVELPNGTRAYHAGDTDLFGDMALIGELLHPDIAFLPIGGHYTMGPRAAAKAVGMLGVTTVVPIHYGTFPVLAGTPDELRTELVRTGLGHVRLLTPEPGDSVAL
jgi:L-ascorbate metabolism protein UlaG (beta-lactamase superfamily)